MVQSVRLVNAGERASLSIDGRLVDVERRSQGRFPSDPMAVLASWPEFNDWARGQRAEGAAAERALDFVAGYCVCQGISDRRLQFSDRPRQFCLGKSARAYGPIGPAVVSLDALSNPLDLALSCEGEGMQDGRTSDMIFPVPELIAYLSHYCVLDPGDIIFTGTPSGVGSARKPRRYLAEGELITSEIEGLGRLENRCVARV
jgi:2-keto-4-pentenoate hydratase/2-oxohepta-3-ene-1,7-dioic acid hydratase in catechol pathway